MPGYSATDRAGEQTRWKDGRSRWIPPLPYVVLATLLAVGSLGCALLATFASDRRELRPIDLAGGAACLAMALLVWFLAPRAPHGWGLDAALLATVLSTFAAIPFIDVESGRVLTGFVVVLFGVFAAYFLPRSRFAGVLAVTLVAYGIAVLAVSPTIPPMYYLMVAIVTASVSVFVSVLVTQLREQALTDSLTGLLNRRGLGLMGTFVAADATRKGTPTSVALIDLDGFKGFNDEHGHLAGDALLVDVGRALTLGLRSTDIVARFGGDEFALLLPGTTPTEARILIDRITRDSPDASWSVGVASWPAGQLLEDALHAADQSMYGEKKSRG